MSSFDSLLRGLNAAVAHAPVAASAAVRRTAYAIEADAKVRAPVDTGALRNSISTTVTEGMLVEAEVGPSVDYGEYVELGTSRMGPQPYLGPAFDAHAHQLEPALLALAALVSIQPTLQRWTWVDAIKAHLAGNVTNAQGFVGRPVDPAADPEGHVRPYWVLHVGAGTPGVEVDLADTVVDAGLWLQVTCVAAYDRDLFALVDRVHTALYRWTPVVPDLVAGPLKPPPGYDPGPPREDTSVQPPRLWVPLQYATSLTAT